jgi:hypothetical protein
MVCAFAQAPLLMWLTVALLTTEAWTRLALVRMMRTSGCALAHCWHKEDFCLSTDPLTCCICTLVDFTTLE